MAFAVATWNVNSLRVRKDHVVKWSEEHPDVDVLCLQETKVEDNKFPHDALAERWPHRIVWGQKTYNGVAMLSKHPIEDGDTGFRVGKKDKEARLVRGTVNGVRIFGCYVPNGKEVGHPKFRYKLAWLRHLRAELDAEGEADRDVLVCGDFNVAPAEVDTYDPWEMHNSLLFHPLEHQTLAKVADYGLIDATRRVHPDDEQLFTWWDYRANGFRRNIGFRIDHHWITEPLAQRLTDVETHRDVRGWEQPSDHVPVVARFEDR